MMKVAHIIPYIGRDQGGPVLSMAGMASGLAKKGVNATLVVASRPNDGMPSDFCSDIVVKDFEGSRAGMFRWSPEMSNFLHQNSFDILHSHSLWTYPTLAAGGAARRNGTPHVLATCGMLQAGALKHAALKKRIYRVLCQDRILHRASCLHVKSDAEYEGIRKLGFKNPVAVIPNPISVHGSSCDDGTHGALCEKTPAFRGKTVLFLGRIHPVKGLQRLIEVWRDLTEFNKSWQLVLAGPDEEKHQAEIETQIIRSGCQDSVHFTGALDEQWKWAALRATNLFVMPSDFENFGSSVAEAMTAGKAVITTTGTPWQVLHEEKAGWWVDPNAESLRKAFQEAMTMSDEDRSAMGARGQSIACQFATNTVAGQLIELYSWLLHKGSRPDFVRLD